MFKLNNSYCLILFTFLYVISLNRSSSDECTAFDIRGVTTVLMIWMHKVGERCPVGPGQSLVGSPCVEYPGSSAVLGN
jgi:hypothetical protein